MGDPEMEGTARREMVTAPLPPPEEGRVENPLFCFCSAAGPAASGTQNFNKRAVSSVSGSQEEESGVPCITGSLPSSSLARQGGLPKSTPPAHLWNRVRAVALKPPLQVVTCKPGSCVSSHTRRNQVSVTLHTQTPPPAITGQAFTGPGPGPCVPHRCPTTGTSVAPLVPLARSLGAWLALPSPSQGSYGPSDTAMRFSSPGVPPSSGASGSLQSNPPMLLSCVRKSQSYWRRTR